MLSQLVWTKVPTLRLSDPPMFLLTSLLPTIVNFLGFLCQYMTKTGNPKSR